jgi:hypothetical protein
MIKYLVFVAFLFIQSLVFASHKIVLIHGFGGYRFTMNKIERSIRKQNFMTENYGYKSTTDLDTLGKQLYCKIKLLKLDTVSFVTHSMGAMVVRSMLKYSENDKDFPEIFRIVMIAPPNSGTEVADFYASLKIFNFLLGPNIEYLRTDSDSYTNKLPKPYHSEIGIIAGIYGGECGYNPFIKGDNDGVVKPERTRLGIEKDFVAVKGEHSLLLNKKYVCKLTVEFLQSGSFSSNQKLR